MSSWFKSGEQDFSFQNATSFFFFRFNSNLPTIVWQNDKVFQRFPSLFSTAYAINFENANGLENICNRYNFEYKTDWLQMKQNTAAVPSIRFLFFTYEFNLSLWLPSGKLQTNKNDSLILCLFDDSFSVWCLVFGIWNWCWIGGNYGFFKWL